MFFDVMLVLVEFLFVLEVLVKLCCCDCIEVCELGVYGCGVYVVVVIVCGKKIIEYKGEYIMWKEVLCCYFYDLIDLNYMFYFSLEDGSVIDVKYGGNCVCWINYVCKLNCEVWEVDGCVFIYVLCDIEVGEELFYDYGFVIEGC